MTSYELNQLTQEYLQTGGNITLIEQSRLKMHNEPTFPRSRLSTFGRRGCDHANRFGKRR